MSHRISESEATAIRRNSDWVRLLGGGDRPVIFDVGANRGEVGLRYLDQLPNAEIWAFEPNPILFGALQSIPGVNAFPFALGSSDGEARLSRFSDDTVGSVESVDPRLVALSSNYTLQDSIVVVKRSIDSLVTGSERAPVPVILKVDVEGHELEVLKGAHQTLSTGQLHIVQVELHFAVAYVGQPRVHQVLQLMDDHGFRLHGFDQLISTRKGNLYWGDATFLSQHAWDALGFL